MTDLEHKIKDALENYQVPNVTPDWDVFEKKLDASKKKKSGAGFIAAALIGLLAGLAFVYNTDTQNTTSVINSNITKESNSATIVMENNSNADARQIHPKKKQNISTDLTDKQTELELNADRNEKRGILQNPSARLMLIDGEDYPISSNEKSEIQKEKDELPAFNLNKPTEVIISKKVSCINEEVQFSTNDRCNCSYKWDFGDGTIGYNKIPSHVYEYEGTYKVAVTITSKTTRKSHFAYRADVKISDNPIADFDYTEPNWSQCETNHEFVSSSVGSHKQKWFINGVQHSETATLSYAFVSKGNSKITLVTENIYGCTNTHTEDLYIKHEYNLAALKTFSPNGDGINDMWLPEHLNCLNGEFSLIIADINGTVVFQTTSTDKKWDGSIMGSSEFANKGGTYAWTATYVDNNGENRIAKGAITLPTR
jgi:gliding motility-associated-like protein